MCCVFGVLASVQECGVAVGFPAALGRKGGRAEPFVLAASWFLGSCVCSARKNNSCFFQLVQVGEFVVWLVGLPGCGHTV